MPSVRATASVLSCTRVRRQEIIRQLQAAGRDAGGGQLVARQAAHQQAPCVLLFASEGGFAAAAGHVLYSTIQFPRIPSRLEIIFDLLGPLLSCKLLNT